MRRPFEEAALGDARQEGLRVDEGVGVLRLAGAPGAGRPRATQPEATVGGDQAADDRPLADPAGPADDEDQGRAAASSSDSRCLAPRPWSRRVSLMPTCLHEAASLDLARTGERLENRQHLHLADDLVRLRLDEQLPQGDSTTLQVVLDLGALAARSGRLLERRVALLGREARRLGHGRLR